MISGVSPSPAVEQAEAVTVVPATEAVDTGWFWDEGRPGEGDRPEWLKSKYSKVTDQAKAYIEAEKYIGNGKAPESYDLSDYSDYFDLESEHIAELSANAKDSRLSEESLKKILEPIKKYHESMMPNVDDEIKKLGDHANARINTVNTWASNNLSEKAMDTLGRVSVTADVFELFDEIRQLHATSSRVPSGSEAASEHKMISVIEVEGEIKANYARYKSDPKFRAEIQAKLQLALGDD